MKVCSAFFLLSVAAGGHASKIVPSESPVATFRWLESRSIRCRGGASSSPTTAAAAAAGGCLYPGKQGTKKQSLPAVGGARGWGQLRRSHSGATSSADELVPRGVCGYGPLLSSSKYVQRRCDTCFLLMSGLGTPHVHTSWTISCAVYCVLSILE